ncbi:TPR repeat protein [Candidatus Burkholderia humilis]|nr:TPR repeat protein [Candidatus Burkholderia humilis]
MGATSKPPAHGSSVRTVREAPNLLVNLALTYGNTAPAQALLERAIALDATHVSAWHRLSALLREQGRDAECEVALRRLIELTPADADVLNNPGGLLAQMKRHDEGRPLIERALALRPDFGEAWSNLAGLEMETGDDEAAIALMDGARFARGMEAAYRHMWYAWCAEQ